VRAPDLASVHTRNEFGVAEANIERAYDGFHAFLPKCIKDTPR
jgi:hypothetical protein